MHHFYWNKVWWHSWCPHLSIQLQCMSNISPKHSQNKIFHEHASIFWKSEQHHIHDNISKFRVIQSSCHNGNMAKWLLGILKCQKKCSLESCGSVGSWSNLPSWATRMNAFCSSYVVKRRGGRGHYFGHHVASNHASRVK